MNKTEEKELKERLAKEIGIANWKALKAHFLRGALIEVSSELDLLDVGIIVAQDRSDEIRQLIEKGKLLKPTPGDTDDWKKDSTEFSSLILSPFVLIQKQT